MENTDKKNQHYLPKFYLRNFSWNHNLKQIGLFNLKNQFYVQRAKLKTQASSDYFYGKDGIIEDALSDIEDSLTVLIRQIIDSKVLPSKNSFKHLMLLSFVVLTHIRNPVQIEGVKNSAEEMKKLLKKINPDVDTEKSIPSFTHEETINISFSNIPYYVKSIQDLDFKLLINNTSNPFISSDFPVVKYNQFLEFKKWKYTKSGYGAKGLEIFIPLNSELVIIFYDPLVYKVGYKKKQYFEINNPIDIDQINTLQFVNCFENIYFDEKARQNYIFKIFNNSKKYIKANRAISHLGHLIKPGKEDTKPDENNLMIVGSTDCKIKLQIEGLKLNSHVRGIKLDSRMAQLRPSFYKRRANKNSR